MLTDQERAILDLEGKALRQPGVKAAAIGDLDLTETRYAQLLNDLIERQDALEYAPVTVKRVRRLRAERMGKPL